MKNYELIEHTADVGIRVKAEDLKGLFENSAAAMFDIIACRVNAQSSCQSKEIIIKLESEDLEELFVTWLNELLSLSSAKELIFYDFKINKIDRNMLQAIVAGEEMKNYKVNAEIKAATYHQLKLEETSSGWQAEVIFDV